MAELPEILWQPQDPEQTPMSAYRRHVNSKFGLSLHNTQELQTWSVQQDQDFWVDLYGYLELVPSLPKGITKAYDGSLPMSAVPKWFEGLELNYAENVLTNADFVPNQLALIGIREGMSVEGDERATWAELRERVRMVSNALRNRGVKQGDVVAALVSTSVESIVLFLSTACVGAAFSSISPDLGAEVRVGKPSHVCQLTRV